MSEALLNNVLICKIVKDALLEDAAANDITTLDFINPKTRAQARIISKDNGVVCGVAIVQEVFKKFDPTLRLKIFKKDGQSIKKGDEIIEIQGFARSILSCERVALNFLSYLSGIATQTYEVVRIVRPKGIQILDTRKTTPLLRSFEKYAVLTGQGKNHRFDLSQQYLVKDNHFFVLRKLRTLDNLRSRQEGVLFEIEVDNFSELKNCLSFCPDIVLLDNFSVPEIKKAISYIAKLFPHRDSRPLIELSGGISFKNISRYAIRGVDFISLGALTHSTRALDMSLEIVKVYNK